jgi:hypothetical protein
MSTTYTLYAQRPSCLKAHAAGIPSGWTLVELKPGFDFYNNIFFFFSTPQLQPPVSLGYFDSEEALYSQVERELRYIDSFFADGEMCEVDYV